MMCVENVLLRTSAEFFYFHTGAKKEPHEDYPYGSYSIYRVN